MEFRRLLHRRHVWLSSNIYFKQLDYRRKLTNCYTTFLATEFLEYTRNRSGVDVSDQLGVLSFQRWSDLRQTRRRCSSRVNASAMTEVLSAPATTAAPAWACARGWKGAAPEALGSSKLSQRRRTQAWRSDASFGLDRQRSAPQFHAALRDSELSAGPALGRRMGPGTLSARQPLKQFFRDRPVVSSSQGSSSRSFAWPPVTSQVPGPLLPLFLWLHRRKIAKPRYQLHQYKSRVGTARTFPILACCAACRW